MFKLVKSLFFFNLMRVSINKIFLNEKYAVFL